MVGCQMCNKWTKDADLQIAELKHTYVTLNRDQFFPGYCFVYTKEHVTELFYLSPEIRCTVMNEVANVAEALFMAFHPQKINYELLGNMVPHMHWHVVPRFTSDPLWPHPIWSKPHDPVTLPAEKYASQIALIQSVLRLP